MATTLSSDFRRFQIGTSKQPNGSWETNKLNLQLYDTLTLNWQHYSPRDVLSKASAIKEAWLSLQSSNEFASTLHGKPDSLCHIDARMKLWGARLSEVVQGDYEKRLFTGKLKEDLFRLKPQCALCGQAIIFIDDAEVDHVWPWSKGGATTLTNAQLSHRFCNRGKCAALAS